MWWCISVVAAGGRARPADWSADGWAAGDGAGGSRCQRLLHYHSLATAIRCLCVDNRASKHLVSILVLVPIVSLFIDAALLRGQLCTAKCWQEFRSKFICTGLRLASIDCQVCCAKQLISAAAKYCCFYHYISWTLHCLVTLSLLSYNVLPTIRLWIHACVCVHSPWWLHVVH